MTQYTKDNSIDKYSAILRDTLRYNIAILKIIQLGLVYFLGLKVELLNNFS
jgi:hypothetical protein